MRSVITLLISFSLFFTSFTPVVQARNIQNKYEYFGKAPLVKYGDTNYPEIQSTIKLKHRKFRKNLHLPPKYKVLNDYHYPTPMEAMSLEVDSAMVGFMHGTGAAATAMTSVASTFAFGSCILGMANIFNAVKSMGKAKALLQHTEKMLEAIDNELSVTTDQDNSYHYYELNQNKAFFKDLKKKIELYLRDEDKSIKINALISTGTFAEFMGFIGSESMLGHANLFPALAPVAEYFLAGGLIIVSATSLWEASKEAKEILTINALRVPGLKQEILVVPNIIRDIFIEHKEDLISEYQGTINVMLDYDTDSPLDVEKFEKYLKKEYENVIRKRVNQQTTNSVLKLNARFLVGAGTGIFAAHEIAGIAGVALLPAIGLSITGAGVGVGVLLGVIGYFYYIKHIKTHPLLDIEGLHTNHFEILRMEIFSLLLKLNLIPPSETDDFMEHFHYFLKLSPIDDFSHMEGSPEQVPLFDKYEHDRDYALVTLKIISKLIKKGMIHKTTKPLMKELFYEKPPEVFNDWKPYVIWNDKINKGKINWTLIATDCFQNEDPKAKQLMDLFIRSAINMELKNLKTELKMSLDQFIKMLKKHSKSKRKSSVQVRKS